MAITARTVTARKAFPCEGYRCRETVWPGSDYARHVAFPGDEVNNGPGLWVLRICAACQTKYGQPMPPRHTKGGRDG